MPIIHHNHLHINDFFLSKKKAASERNNIPSNMYEKKHLPAYKAVISKCFMQSTNAITEHNSH